MYIYLLVFVIGIFIGGFMFPVNIKCDEEKPEMVKTLDKFKDILKDPVWASKHYLSVRDEDEPIKDFEGLNIS